MYRFTSFWVWVAGIAIMLGAGTVVFFVMVKPKTIRASKAVAAFFAGLIGLGAATGCWRSCYARSYDPPSSQEQALASERVRLAMEELNKLYDSKAITEELFNIRRAALNVEMAALNAPDMTELVNTEEWRQLVELWRIFEMVEKENLKSGHDKKSVATVSEALLKSIRDHKCILDTMKAKKLLSDSEYGLLFSILDTNLDIISSVNKRMSGKTAVSHACYALYAVEKAKDEKVFPLETCRVSLENLNKFYAEGVINESTYTLMKDAYEKIIKKSERVARPTGRAALILAALSGVKPAGQ